MCQTSSAEHLPSNNPEGSRCWDPPSPEIHPEPAVKGLLGKTEVQTRVAPHAPWANAAAGRGDSNETLQIQAFEPIF